MEENPITEDGREPSEDEKERRWKIKKKSWRFRRNWGGERRALIIKYEEHLLNHDNQKDLVMTMRYNNDIRMNNGVIYYREIDAKDIKEIEIYMMRKLQWCKHIDDGYRIKQ